MKIRKKYLLQRNQQYHFYILFNVHPESLSKINYKIFGIEGMSLESPEFKLLVDEISQLRATMQKFLPDLHHFGGQQISYLIFSRSEQNLARFFGFLAMLCPSNIILWIEFETQPSSAKEFEPKARNILGTFAEWEGIFQLYDRVDNNGFYLPEQDIKFANALLKTFNDLSSRNKSFLALLGLYQRAYQERKVYFKYLLLLMVIESIIEDSGNDNIKYKVRRLCASLIGTNKYQCEQIFHSAGKAYDIRSKLVHRANFNIERAMLLFVHSMVCELLLFMLVSGIEKSDLFDHSTILGYGHRNSLIKHKKFRREPFRVNFVNLFNADLSQRTRRKKQ